MASDQLATTRTRLLIGLRVLGAGLLFGTAGIHLHLWLSGYRHIPTIGDLFLVQIVVGFLLGLAVLVLRAPLVAAIGAVFAAGTLVGYEVFRIWTIFGFHEVRTDFGFDAGILEALAFIALGAYAVLGTTPAPTAAAGSTAPPRRDPVERVAGALGRPTLLGTGALVGVALLVAVGVSALPKGSTPAPAATGGGSGLTIVIKSFAFRPTSFTVTPGEKITVKNEDSVAHTFSALPGSTPAGHFDSGQIAGGASATVTAPTAPGAYKYQCSNHTFMIGVMTVS